MVSHRSRPENRHEVQGHPDGAGDAIPHPERESFGMQVDHFVERSDEETHNDGGRILLPDGSRLRPKLRLQLLGPADALAQLPRTNGFQADAYIFAKKPSDLSTIRLGQQSGSQISRADCIRLIDDQSSSDLEAGGGHAKRERQHEREEPECRGVL